MRRRAHAILRHRDAPPPWWLGHNGGPPLDDRPDPEAAALWRDWTWRRAYARAWRTPPREIALARLARAEALGMTYRAYALEILERGRHL